MKSRKNACYLTLQKEERKKVIARVIKVKESNSKSCQSDEMQKFTHILWLTLKLYEPIRAFTAFSSSSSFFIGPKPLQLLKVVWVLGTW